MATTTPADFQVGSAGVDTGASSPAFVTPATGLPALCGYDGVNFYLPWSVTDSGFVAPGATRYAKFDLTVLDEVTGFAVGHGEITVPWAASPFSKSSSEATHVRVLAPPSDATTVYRVIATAMYWQVQPMGDGPASSEDRATTLVAVDCTIDPRVPDYLRDVCSDAETVTCTVDPIVPCEQSSIKKCRADVDLCDDIAAMSSSTPLVLAFKARCLEDRECPEDCIHPPCTDCISPPCLDCIGPIEPPCVECVVEPILELKVPDLCDDYDDDYYMVDSDSPEKDAIVIATLLLGPRALSGGSSSSPIELNIVFLGDLDYGWERWKCIDRDGLNEYRWYRDHFGFSGYGSQWSYGDDYTQRVICYEAPEVDAGDAPCMLSAKTPPEYTKTASMNLGPFTCSAGVAEWHNIPSTAPVLWNGEFEGLCTMPPIAVAVAAELIGYL